MVWKFKDLKNFSQKLLFRTILDRKTAEEREKKWQIANYSQLHIVLIDVKMTIASTATNFVAKQLNVNNSWQRENVIWMEFKLKVHSLEVLN